MPIYEFECKKCEHRYEALMSITKCNDKKELRKVKCPECKSTSKIKLISGGVNFTFANPVGTDRWNNGSTGHDYRHNYNMDRPGGVRDQRKEAEEKSHMGSNPYPEIDDISSGEHFGEVK